MFNLVSTPFSRLARQIRLRYSFNDFRGFDLLPILNSPLVEYKGKLVCLSLEALSDKTFRGLYHIHTNPSKLRGQKRKRYIDESTRYFGKVFEYYGNQILNRMYLSTGPFRILFNETVLKAFLKGHEKVCDAILLLGQEAILIEFKSSVFTIAVREGLDREGLMRPFVKASGQLHRSIEHIKKGRFAAAGLSPDHIRHYQPLVILLDENPTSKPLMETLAEDFKKRQVLMDDDVFPLQILDISELEDIEELVRVGKDFATMLRLRRADAGLSTLSFRSFWHQFAPRSVGRKNEFLLKEFEAFTRRNRHWYEKQMKEPL